MKKIYFYATILLQKYPAFNKRGIYYFFVKKILLFAKKHIFQRPSLVFTNTANNIYFKDLRWFLQIQRVNNRVYPKVR